MMVQEFEDQLVFNFDDDDADFGLSKSPRVSLKPFSKDDNARYSPVKYKEDSFQLLKGHRLQAGVRLSDRVVVKTHPANCNMRQVDLKSRTGTPTSWYDNDVTSEHGLVLDLDDNGSLYYNENVLTLEELKNQYNSCFTCGVTWTEDHVSLDCFECGGYSMQRPCPNCDGSCQQVWRRDLVMTHAMHKAHWEGECGLIQKNSVHNNNYYLQNSNQSPRDPITQAMSNLKAT